ncbi:MAG: OmpH family outer membrane protein [Bacteroidales bacterium]|jgi:outer membrane protein|nr:OmpH family outer membrane protein [Bacteroidales bacterium]MBQ1192013.1 OmpH family outer membrane protein [Bacteroidales bacterium]MBQ2304141.1 OmpH family outer membrane protein [Bacteroidales bacterium]MBQ2386727.1 OmpH family outer membrane protein [Bacteroidales bacterium]MEE0900098.1 OmpH family outer membrane protein [Bacteroidales bacterium]
MKKYLIVLLLTVLSLGGYAQKYACVDTEYILSNVPEYKQAQKELEEVSVQWQKEVEVKFQAVDRLYKAFQAEAVILPADLKAQKENEIIAAEKEAKNLQKQRFGNDGDLAKKRSELVKPIQDRIYNAIEKVAQEKNYSVVFDKAGGATILYVDNKTDISDLVLAELGYKISSQKR